jgi:glycogen(starch) synthase
MNILVFTTAIHPSIGGLEKQTLSLIYEFVRNGHQVKVITMQFKGITMTSVASELKGIEIYYKPNFLKKLRLYLWCNVLYMPNLSLRGFWLILANPFKKWVISHNDFYLSNKKNLTTRIKLVFLKFASQNIAVSKCVAKYINTKSTIIYNCYDNDVFKIYEDEQRIYDFVFLGRLVSQKGCDLLIRACKNLGQPFTLNIIGDGPERQKLEKLVQDAGLNQNISFLGMLEGSHLARMLNRHRTMVIPSVGEEGFGIVALEGMACGCRIIAADAGGLSEAVDGFGKTFKMSDQNELECLLKEEMSELNQKSNISISNDLNRYLSAHHKEAIAQKYLMVFKSIVMYALLF